MQNSPTTPIPTAESDVSPSTTFAAAPNPQDSTSLDTLPSASVQTSTEVETVIATGAAVTITASAPLSAVAT